jgi:asparagine synthase (glutamine-hydrolysing)
MFAFALWDASRQRLWLVRDRLGKKPLYYCHHRDVLRFGSEIKAVLADERVPRTLSREGLKLYLRYGYVPAPLTIFEHVRKLPPGHYLVYENGVLTPRRYWWPLDFALNQREIVEADALAEFEMLLATAVGQRQIADVPLGAFLSGGIDSSLVVALMQEQNAAPVKTFTIRFERREFDEADHAAAVAKHLGTEHHEQACTEREMLAAVERLPRIFDEPFGDSSAIPTYMVSKAARQHVTVALSGDGGDELFFGYPRYQQYGNVVKALSLPSPVLAVAASAAARLPGRLRRVADVIGHTDGDPYARLIAWFSRAQIAAMGMGDAEDSPAYREMRQQLTAGSVDERRRPGLLDLVSYLPDDILTKVDRASMAEALEVRAPLLDHRIVEFALRLPFHFLQRGRCSKWLLRQSLYKRVPRTLLERPKMGFGVPLSDWFRGPLRAAMDDCCDQGALEDLGLDGGPIRTLWKEFKNGHPHRPDLLWQTFALVRWFRAWTPTPSLSCSVP